MRFLGRLSSRFIRGACAGLTAILVATSLTCMFAIQSHPVLVMVTAGVSAASAAAWGV